jgi:uncharacterized protein (TIGR02117 family)
MPPLASLGLLLAFVAGCAGPVPGLYPPAAGEPIRPIYVVNHGWHTGIAVRRADIPEAVWPQHRDLRASEYVEVGWGNRDFYLAPKGTVWLALRAAVWPTAGVLHVVGFDGPVERFFGGREIVEVLVSDRGFHQLAVVIQEAYAKDDAGMPIVVSPGQYANSSFYVAREKYYLLKTCNTWTVMALQAAGLPVARLSVVTAASAIGEARRFGRVLTPRMRRRSLIASAIGRFIADGSRLR